MHSVAHSFKERARIRGGRRRGRVEESREAAPDFEEKVAVLEPDHGQIGEEEREERERERRERGERLLERERRRERRERRREDKDELNASFEIFD